MKPLVSRTICKSLARIVWLVCCAVACCAASVTAAEANRLIDGEPFDELTLDAENNNAVLKVLPLDLPNRLVPNNPNPEAKIRLRLFERPARLYECQWRYIVRLRLFEQMVLEQAERLTADGDFTQAFEYYEYLNRSYPRTPGLVASFDNYLFKNAIAEATAKNFEAAFPLLFELYGRNSQFPRLDRAFEAVGERVIEGRIAAERYAAARAAIALVREKFVETPLPKIERLRNNLIQKATQLRDEAQQNVQANQLRQAQRVARLALAIWPELEGLAALNRQIDARYPLVYVGVLQPATSAVGQPLENWADRRIGRMLLRQPVELIGYSVDGGIYRSPFGGLSRDDSGLRWSIQMRSGIVVNSGEQRTGHDLARALLTTESTPGNQAWQGVLQSVAVQQLFTVQMTMNRTLVRPERLLETADVLAPTDTQAYTSPQPQLWALPYYQQRGGEIAERETRFLGQPGYFAKSPLMPQEVVETHYPDAEEAVLALRRGEIDVLDRVPPWAVASLTNEEELVVDRYLLPTVHALLPHPNSKLAANRNLRRALMYGIAQQAILDRALLAGRTEPGNLVVSSPFVAGASFDDPLGYGSNPNIQPLPWEPRMAVALLAIASKELAGDAAEAEPKDADKVADDKSDDDDASSLPQPKSAMLRLVIAHPPEPVAALACASIVGQLAMVGVEVELVPLTDPAKVPAYDFRYAELAAWEPVVDAARLFNAHGPVQTHSSYLSVALSKLAAAENWREVRERMGEVHRLVASELPLLPLWQTVNHFAYRRGALEIGEQPVALYQYVETWKATNDLADRK